MFHGPSCVLPARWPMSSCRTAPMPETTVAASWILDWWCWTWIPIKFTKCEQSHCCCWFFCWWLVLRRLPANRVSRIFSCVIAAKWIVDTKKAYTTRPSTTNIRYFLVMCEFGVCVRWWKTLEWREYVLGLYSRWVLWYVDSHVFLDVMRNA